MQKLRHMNRFWGNISGLMISLLPSNCRYTAYLYHSKIAIYNNLKEAMVPDKKMSSKINLLRTQSTTSLPRRTGRITRLTASQSTHDNARNDGLNNVERRRKNRCITYDADNGINTYPKNESEKNLNISSMIIQTMESRADEKTKAWFTNYVKGTVWIGCKTPLVRTIVKETITSIEKDLVKNGNDKVNVMTTPKLYEEAILLIRHPASDVKLAGMIILQEWIPIEELSCIEMIERLERDVLLTDPAILNDWSSVDWFAVRVLTTIIHHEIQQIQKRKHDVSATDWKSELKLSSRILEFAMSSKSTAWHRRCGLVPFVKYYQKPKLYIPVKLPTQFTSQLIHACEAHLMIQPSDRFTQTGIAWVLRYVLLLPDDEGRTETYRMIERKGSVWTTEAKKSFVEKLGSSDPYHKSILSFK